MKNNLQKVSPQERLSLVDPFHPPSDFTLQTELFAGKWVDDGSADGQYGRKYPEPFLVRLLDGIDRAVDRKQREAQVLTFDEKIKPGDAPFNRLRVEAEKAHRKGRLPCINWIDEMPEGTGFFAEICDRPRAPFWWLPWLSLERRASLDPDFRDECQRGDWD